VRSKEKCYETKTQQSKIQPNISSFISNLDICPLISQSDIVSNFDILHICVTGIQESNLSMIGDKVPTIFFSGSGLGIKPFCLGNSKKRKISYTSILFLFSPVCPL
jgi:hypothetical protein